MFEIEEVMEEEGSGGTSKRQSVFTQYNEDDDFLNDGFGTPKTPVGTEDDSFVTAKTPVGTEVVLSGNLPNFSGIESKSQPILSGVACKNQPILSVTSEGPNSSQNSNNTNKNRKQAQMTH